MSEKKVLFMSMQKEYSHLREESTHKREVLGVIIPEMGKNIVEIFGANLARNTGPEKKFQTISDLGRRAGIGKSTIARIKNNETATKIDNVQAIAEAFGLSAWQLLVPDLDVDNPPQLAGGDIDERTYAIMKMFESLEEGQKIVFMNMLKETLKSRGQPGTETDPSKKFA